MSHRTQSGYMTLLAVLIVGAVASAIGITLLLTGSDAQRSGLSEQQSIQARQLANACAEEGMEQIRDNTAYTGSGNLSQGVGTCTYTAANTGTTTRTISSSGTVNGVVKKTMVYVTIGSSSISVTSWQEVT